MMTKLGPKECLLGCCLLCGDTDWVADTMLSRPANLHLLNVSDSKFLVAPFVFQTYMERKWLTIGRGRFAVLQAYTLILARCRYLDRAARSRNMTVGRR